MIKIGNKKIGDGQPTFITFEAGPTHDGLETAKELIKIAADSGADAVKFQIFDVDKLVRDKSLPYTYDILVNKDTGEVNTITEPLYDLLKRRCLKEAEWIELKAYADSFGLAFFSTVGDEDDIKLVQKIGCQSIKIASADINHLPLLRLAANTGLSIQLDTGNATFGEIERAVDVIRGEGNEQIIIHNCPTGYPARLESINLKMLPALKTLFDCPVAYSDHTPGNEMDIAAIALGANLVEKTITKDRCTPSVEHIMSLEPQETIGFIKTIREVEKAMGSSRRILDEHEKSKRYNVRRSVVIAEPVKSGQKLKDVKVKFQRPGYGIAPDQYEELLDKTLNKDCPADYLLTLQDLA
jgi:sialic acid synthase SpsE